MTKTGSVKITKTWGKRLHRGLGRILAGGFKKKFRRQLTQGYSRKGVNGGGGREFEKKESLKRKMN